MVVFSLCDSRCVGILVPQGKALGAKPGSTCRPFGSRATGADLERSSCRTLVEALATVPSLKSRLQTLLKRMGIYHRLKASPLYYLYWSVADRSMVEEASRELNFYGSLLGGFKRGDVVFDIGANQGAKTETFLRLGARVVAVDPDEVNKEILENKFLKYRLSPK